MSTDRELKARDEKIWRSVNALNSLAVFDPRDSTQSVMTAYERFEQWRNAQYAILLELWNTRPLLPEGGVREVEKFVYAIHRETGCIKRVPKHAAGWIHASQWTVWAKFPNEETYFSSLLPQQEGKEKVR